MSATEISHEQAVEIDTKLAELWSISQKASATILQRKNSLARTCDLEKKYYGGRSRDHYYAESVEEVIAIAERRIKDGVIRFYMVDYVERDINAIREAKAQYEAAREEAEPLEALYAKHQWSRFFLVVNTNGHIHSSMSCHSCGIRTLFNWLPELSGLTEKDAVEAHGTILCSHCFPTAPVEWTLGKQVEADPNECPGSGTYDWDRSYAQRRYVPCNHCGQSVNKTSTGKLRKHKKVSA